MYWPHNFCTRFKFLESFYKVLFFYFHMPKNFFGSLGIPYKNVFQNNSDSPSLNLYLLGASWSSKQALPLDNFCINLFGFCINSAEKFWKKNIKLFSWFCCIFIYFFFFFWIPRVSHCIMPRPIYLSQVGKIENTRQLTILWH